jgi:hypothetical protein
MRNGTPFEIRILVGVSYGDYAAAAGHGVGADDDAGPVVLELKLVLEDFRTPGGQVFTIAAAS